MDDEQKPDLLLLLPATRRRAACHQKVASLDTNPTVNFRDWMNNNKGTISETRPQSVYSRKEKSSVKLPSPSPTPQNQTGQSVMIKEEPWPTEITYNIALTSDAEDWIGPSKVSDNKSQTHSAPEKVKLTLPFPRANRTLHNRALTSAAEDWIGPSKLSDNKSQAHSASDKVKLTKPFPSANPTLHNKAPPLRPTPQPNPVPTTNTAKLHLPNISPTQVQGLNTFQNMSIPTRPRSSFKRKAGEIEQPHISNDCMMKKSADNLVCNLCQISCSGAATMQQHLKGRRHKAKMEFMMLKRSCTTNRGIPGRPRCNACEIWCTDRAALEMHYKGQRHKSKLQELQLCKQRGGHKLSKAPVICELCQVPCMNQELFESHLKGRQHATKEKLKRMRFH